MPVQPTYPGVYIEELPSGSRTITAVATSVTAFVGRTRRGSVTEPIACFSFADFQRRCGGLWAASELGYAVSQFFANGGGQALVSRVATGATTPTTSIAGVDGASNFVLRAADPGAWGSALRVTVSHGTTGEVDETADDDTFHLTIDEVDTVAEAAALTIGDPVRQAAALAAAILVREQFLHVSVVEDASRWVGRILEQQSALVRLTTTSDDRPIEVERQSFGAAVDGGTGSNTDYTAAIERLALADIVNLVCVPPPARGSDISLAVLGDALAFSQRARAILLIDPPAAWTDAAAAAALTGGYDALRSHDAAYYWPAIRAADPLEDNRVRTFAPCGAVAGVIARVDGERGVWKSPAGLDATLAGVAALAADVTDVDSGIVNERGVNALRRIAPAGALIWGARTARGADTLASPWKYLAVRRIALFIEESLRRGTQWAVFEGNDEPLWGQLRASIGAFMRQLFRQGAFQGKSANEAYFVRCDATTTTSADIERGVVNVIVGFAPLKPAEFVMLQFQQLAGQ